MDQFFSKIWILIILIIFIAGGIFAWQYFRVPEKKVEDLKEITQEETADWQIYRDEEMGFEFRYPEAFNQEYKYIKTREWPPKITVKPLDPDFICEEFESLAGQGPPRVQKEIVLKNTRYCVFTLVEGAMGSTYRDYKYITNKNDKQLTIEFSLISSNCGAFYEIDNKMEECQEEIKDFKDFDTTSLIDKILSTFRFLE